MSENNTDKELSIDELKDVSGGGMGLDRLGTQKTTGKKKSKGTSLEGWEDRTVVDGDFNDQCVNVKTSNVNFPGYEG